MKASFSSRPVILFFLFVFVFSFSTNAYPGIGTKRSGNTTPESILEKQDAPPCFCKILKNKRDKLNRESAAIEKEYARQKARHDYINALAKIKQCKKDIPLWEEWITHYETTGENPEKLKKCKENLKKTRASLQKNEEYVKAHENPYSEQELKDFDQTVTREVEALARIMRQIEAQWKAIEDLDKKLAKCDLEPCKALEVDYPPKCNAGEESIHPESFKKDESSLFHKKGEDLYGKLEDIVQGYSCQCCLFSVLAAMIGNDAQPSAGAKKLGEMIKPLGNQKYKVKLTKIDYSKDPPTKEEQWVEVDFDGSLKKGDPGRFQEKLSEKDGKTYLDKDYVIRHFWPLLIQRAYMKLYEKPYSCGGRVLPEGEDNNGSISNALRSVTGKDATYTDVRKDKDAWNKIKEALKARKAVVLETNRCPIEDCGHTDEFHTKTDKLYKCHCYAVLGIKKDENGNEKLILFNPHNRKGDNPIELTKEEFEKGVRGFGVSGKK